MVLASPVIRAPGLLAQMSKNPEFVSAAASGRLAALFGTVAEPWPPSSVRPGGYQPVPFPRSGRYVLGAEVGT